MQVTRILEGGYVGILTLKVDMAPQNQHLESNTLIIPVSACGA